jgi:hypothetical protein
MFHNFHDEKLHKKSQGSISKDNFYKIIEIPVTWMERNTGKSRFKLISFILPYTKWQSTSHIINKVSPDEIDSFFSLCSTIGGYIIYPSKRVDNQMTINGARGVNPKIKDRFDLTLECIRRHYTSEKSPLSDTLKRYSSFFNLFENFQGYIDFFLLQDLVAEKYSSIKYFIPFKSFENFPLPNNVDEYRLYKKNMSDFILARGQRMLHFCNLLT